MKIIFAFIVVSFLSVFAQADTVNYEDLPDDPLIGIKLRCAKPTECRKLIPQDFLSGIYLKVKKGESYTDINNQEQIAPNNGYYVGFDNVFLSGPDVVNSPDENYYLCQQGKNQVLDEDNSDLLSPKDPLLNGLALSCPYLWVPKKDEHIPDCTKNDLYKNELPWDCEAGGGDSGSDLGGYTNGSFTGGGDLGGGSLNGTLTGGTLNGGNLNGWSSGGNNNGGDNGNNNGHQYDDDDDVAPIPIPGLMPWSWPWSDWF